MDSGEYKALAVLTMLIIIGATIATSSYFDTKLPKLEGQVCVQISTSAQVANNHTLATGVKAAYYDTQLWMGLDLNSTSLKANVTATAQNDTYGFGPGYLLNGLTDAHLWYQVGISWNWVNYDSTEFSPGFHAIVEVWNATTSKSTYPLGGGSYLGLLNKPVMSGDDIGLFLGIHNNSITLAVTDWRNMGNWTLNLSDRESTEFIGLNHTAPFPTSVLTEWYHVLPYYCSSQRVYFSFSKFEGNTWMTVDEWNFTGVPRPEWFNHTLGDTAFYSTIPNISFKQSPTNSTIADGFEISCNATNFLTT